ncbi:MAG: SagB/ThcOx family dehydrogenase [Desulfomonile tiedjei]|nr:SagB/ThcOx family dehydrogenase [Desulfomonile tiedjei]
MKFTCRLFFIVWASAMVFVPHAIRAADNDIKLPKPSLSGKLSVEAAMAAKKSVRNFSGAPLTEAQVSQLLWAANGDLPHDAVTGATTKVIPSAGGLYPLEVYLVTGKDSVGQIPAGVYRYNPGNNSLQTVTAGDNRAPLAHAALGQTWLAKAPALIVIGAVFQRTTSKYGNRGINYIFMEAGSASQNLYLEAESLGLHAGSVGAFQEANVSGALKLPPNVNPLFIMAFGK